MSLTIALATRGRPEILKRTLERTLPNIKRKDTQLIVLCDHDDLRTAELSKQDLGVTWSIEKREDSVGAKFNRVLGIAPANVYLVMVDYVAFVTPGFDEKVLEAAEVFPDGIGVVYNHLANLSFPFMNAVTKGYVEKTGSIYPEIFPYWFVDHWLDDIARMIGRISYAEVAVKMDSKPQTQGMREPAFWATLFDATTEDRRSIAKGIIESDDFLETEWRKNLLKRNFPMVEQRSLMLNNHVRGISPVEMAHDERYKRIRANAVEIMMARLAELEAA